MKISYSAPAKTILSGEHAVVYGKPALISALNLRLKFTVREEEVKVKDKTIAMIDELVKKHLGEKKIAYTDKKFAYKIDSEIPIGQNLGSSAALSVAASAALLEFYTGKQFSKDEINSVAYEIEKYFHGKPSGGDNSASCFGGLIYFRKEFEFLKNISALNIKIPQKINDALYIIDSGKSQEKTSELVKKVGELYNHNPKNIEEILNDIEKVTKHMVLSINQESVDSFKECIGKNELLLEQLSVVSDKTKKLIVTLSKYGVGKVTGAGGISQGSGNLLFFADQPKELEEFLKIEKISYLKFIQDFEGVRRE